MLLVDERFEGIGSIRGAGDKLHKHTIQNYTYYTILILLYTTTLYYFTTLLVHDSSAALTLVGRIELARTAGMKV